MTAKRHRDLPADIGLLTEEDIEYIRSVQQNDREIDRPFDDEDFMEILIRGGEQLNTLKDEWQKHT